MTQRSTSPARAFAFATAAVALAACGNAEGGKDVTPRASSAGDISLQTFVARDQTVPLEDEAIGTIRAQSVAEISPSVVGTIRTLRVTAGTRVRTGEVLATLSAGEIKAKGDRTLALLDQATADLARAEKLRASGSITPSDLEAAASSFRVAEAANAEAAVMQSYTTIRAPFDGIVVSKLADVGDLAVPGKPILILEGPGSFRIEALVPESLAAGIRVGNRFGARVDALQLDTNVTAVEISPSVNTSSRTLLVKFELPTLPDLRAGMFARVRVPIGTSKVLSVPNDALVRRGQMEFVYVIRDGKALLRIVRSGRVVEGRTEIQAGLTPNETVALGPLDALHDGQPVRTRP